MDPFSHRYRQVSEHARSRGHEPNRRAPRLDAGRRQGPALGRGRDLQVVGESFYQDNLRRLAGARPGEPVRAEITAVLAAEDDNPCDRKCDSGLGRVRLSPTRPLAGSQLPTALPGRSLAPLNASRRCGSSLLDGQKRPSSRAFDGVSEGTRTPDTQDHNLVL